ncbi:PorT family protein [Mucilaginibacter terrenus]|uniref:PorT family protein n=1 Tax=Mucilaginibacter terrenus TaxID=2482727 RepID=A0A3E2NXN5_9SPHI|nr:outer membrane beta-barrel protein [Mucilaginibacter terrenus]RFZ85671.1 PorT family protein [Mucilaginibacter terrenus]
MIKRYLAILTVLLCCSNISRAQQFAPAWGGGADQTDLSFGFSFSYVSSNFKIVKQPNWRSPYFDADLGKPATDSLNSISSPSTPGFAVGFITRYRITDHLEVRTTPSLVFSDKKLIYTYANTTEPIEKQVQTTTVDLPLSLKLKSDRIGNMRAYLLGGVKFSGAIGGKKDDANTAPLDRIVKNVKSYSSYEAGFGFDIYFEYFKLSPELKVTNTFGNMLVPENHPFSSPISKLSLHTIMFSLYFE